MGRTEFVLRDEHGVAYDDMELAMKIGDIFNAYDRDGNGKVTEAELSAILKKLNPDYKDEELQMVIEGADKNEDGKISLTEWINWICDTGYDSASYAQKSELLRDGVIKAGDQLDYEERKRKKQEAAEKRAQEAKKDEDERRAFQAMNYMTFSSFAEKLKASFSCFDRDKSGTITRSKLQQVLLSLNSTWTKDELDALFDVADKNGNGVIDYIEFADFLCYMDETKPDE